MTYNSKKEKEQKSGCIYYVLAIFIIIIFTIIVTFKNIFNYKIIKDFGIKQYICNIIHLHQNKYLSLNSDLKLYDKIVDNPNMIKCNIVLKKEEDVLFQGYRRDEFITWIAIKYLNDNKIKEGYLLIPENVDLFILPGANFMNWDDNINNKYFISSSKSKKWDDYYTNKYDKFYSELVSKIKIYSTSDNLKKNEIIKNKDYKIITKYLNADQNTLYYVKAEDYNKVKKIYKTFYK